MTVLRPMVYRVLHLHEWREMLAHDEFTGSALDMRDGFIHLSERDQVAGTIAKHFVGARDLIVLEIDASFVQDRLRWEPSREGLLFPHLTGSLPLSAVIRAVDVVSFEQDPPGQPPRAAQLKIVEMVHPQLVRKPPSTLH